MILKRGVRATVVFGGAAPNRAGRDICLDEETIVAAEENLDANVRVFFTPASQFLLNLPDLTSTAATANIEYLLDQYAAGATARRRRFRGQPRGELKS